MTKFKKVAKGEITIPTEDIVKVARLCGQNPTNKQIDDAIAAAELSDNETFSEEDCLYVISCIVLEENADGDFETSLRKAFNVFDKDKSGYLDAKEFKAAMLSYGEALSENEIKDMLKMADTNKDGKIQYGGMFIMNSI
jgi:calmodulin